MHCVSSAQHPPTHRHMSSASCQARSWDKGHSDTSLRGPHSACPCESPRRNPLVITCVTVGSLSPPAMDSMSCQSTPHHLPWVPPHCPDSTQHLSRPTWSWAYPFTSDMAQLMALCQRGGRHKRPGTGQYKDLFPSQTHALGFRACSDPTSTTQLHLPCRCLVAGFVSLVQSRG